MTLQTIAHTSYSSFTALIDACKTGYVPTFIISAGPRKARQERKQLADALKAAGHKVFVY